MTGPEIMVTVNGEAKPVAPGTTLADLVAVVTSAETGIAVALNDQVVPHGEWTMHELAGRDRIEILTAVQGG